MILGMTAGTARPALTWATRPALTVAVRPALTWLAAGGPLIGRREGQRLARSELAKVGLLQRMLNWIGRLFDGASHLVPHGWFGLIALAVIAAAAVIVVLFWVRPARAGRSAARPVLTGAARTAQDYRAAAERLAAAGDYGGAIVQGVRAIAAELEQRKILPPRPARTADELAFEAGGELPEAAGDLRSATRLFDDIRYGDKEGTDAGYQLVRRVDAQVRTARVAAAAAGPAAGAAAVLGVPQ